MARRVKALTIYNSKCLCCSKLQQEMVKIGQMTFCSKCFRQEFVYTGAYDPETQDVSYSSQEYKDWFESYKRYIVESG